MTYTYKQSAVLICRGLWSITKKLPGTFGRSTARLVINHPIYLLAFISIIAYQFSIIGQQRAERDNASRHIIELQERLDSIEMKHFVYRRYMQ